jgi:glycerate 2-kinase
MIPRTVLIACSSFEGLSARRVAWALARGFGALGVPVDLCPLDERDHGSDPRRLLDELGFDSRMRQARAVVLAECCLEEPTLVASATFEIATRARQAGVPAYAVAGRNKLGLFDARMLDLQVILEASSTRALTAAGRGLGALV